MNSEFEGTFKANPKGFGFIQATTGEQIFVPPKFAKRMFSLDLVKISASEDDIGRWTTESVESVKETYRRLAGTIIERNNNLFFQPEISILPQLPIYSKTKTEVKDKDRVVIDLLNTPNGWVCDVDINLGQTQKNIESLLSIHQYKINIDSIDDTNIQELDTKKRKNLTKLPFVTIDDQSTRDIDDAVYVKKLKAGYKLYVAIADAAEYIKENSITNEHALNRGTTLYFQQQVYPMLPHKISSDAGSLWPNKEKPVIVCEVDITNKGTLKKYNIYEAIISSKAKLSYDEVTETVLNDKDHDFKSEIINIHDLYKSLLVHRLDRGATPIRSGDYRFINDEQGKPIDCKFKPWQLSNGMIEECMLAANTAVAKWLKDNNLTTIYRHHKGPDQDAWNIQKPFLEALGITINETPSILDLQQIIKHSENIGELTGVENAIRSTMRPAIYTVHNPSHYSLGYDEYVHFTSPLRRFADLTIHRIIKKHLQGEQAYSNDELNRIAENCTIADQRAKKASRDEMKRLKVIFAGTMKNKELEWQITGGNQNGVYLKCTTYPLDTLLSTNQTKWKWNSLNQRLENNGEYKKVGDVIKAEIQDIDNFKLRIICKSNEIDNSKEILSDQSISV